MLKRILNKRPRKNSGPLGEVLAQYNPRFKNKILNHRILFQQDIVEDLREKSSARIPTEDSIDLSGTVCAGVCYWTAVSILGQEERSITEFIEDVYDPSKEIKHPLGLDHVKFVKYLNQINSKIYGLTLNPFREQEPKKFKLYNGYTGKEAENFFVNSYKNIHNTSSAVKEILNNSGFAVVSIQGTFNNYSPNFHDILVLGQKDDSFLIMDPDARVYFNTEKIRPEEIVSIKKSPGLYLVNSDYLDKNTYREKPSPGGITIGIFKS